MSHTISSAIDWAVKQLTASDSAKLDAELLLAHLLDKSRIWLKTWPDRELSDLLFNQYQTLIMRRADGEPVAYILGQQDFWTFTLKVSAATLIPRPETEHLIEFALEQLPLEAVVKVVDLGTGTGAIAMAIASERPKADVWAVDISAEALTIAEQNRKKYQLDNMVCQQGHWLDEWQHGALDMVVSNPPYIAANDPHLADLSYEPESALVADGNGLSDIRYITEQAVGFLKPAGWLIFEHGFEQGESVQQILQQSGFQGVVTIKDYAGHARVTVGQKAEL